MIWLHIAGAVLCWLVALGAFAFFFLLLDECWHSGRQGLRLTYEPIGAIVFLGLVIGFVLAGVSLLPDKESWKVVTAPASHCASFPR